MRPQAEARRNAAPVKAPVRVPLGGFSPSWRVAWTAFAVVFLIVLVTFWETVETVARIYLSNATFNHGFLILPIVGYLFWLRRDALVRLKPRPTPWAFAFSALAGLGWLVGDAAGVDLIQQFALLGILWSLFLAIFGWRVVQALAFPLFYAIFAVPFGDNFVPALQDITAFFAVKGIELFNIPVYSDGLLISIPQGNFEVAEACAGLRFLIATIALGFLFSYLTYTSWWRRAAFLVLCVVVPIIANGIRAWGIVFIGYQSDMEAAVGFDHIIYGWIFFAIVTAVLLAIGMAFRDREIGSMPPPSGAPDLRPAASHGLIATVAVGTLVLAVAAPAYAVLVVNKRLPATEISLAAPEMGNGWRATSEYRDDWHPVFPTADKTLLRSYVKNGRTVHLFIAYYRAQHGHNEILNYGNRVYDGKTWLRVGSSGAEATVDGQPLNVDSTRVLRGRSGRIIWSWQWVANRYTADPYTSKLLEAQAKLLGGTKAAALIAIATDYDDKPNEALPVLRDFLASAPEIRPLLIRAAAD